MMWKVGYRLWELVQSPAWVRGPSHARIFPFHGAEMLLPLLHKTENTLESTFRIDGLTKASGWLPILYFSLQ